VSKRFGKKRAPNCECTERFTCRPCLESAPPYHHTPNDQFVNPSREARTHKTIDELNDFYVNEMNL
jgi:hypothetical protein